MRMRRRRVERCLLRASVAIEAGVLDDAREAIEEIRRLDPNEPGLEQLTAQLAEAENPQPADELLLEHAPLPALVPDDAPARSRRFAPAVLLLAGAVAGGWWWTSFSTTPAPLKIATKTASLADQPGPSAPPEPSVRVSESSVAAPISAEPLRGGDAPIATSGLPASIESSRAEPEVRAGGTIEQPRPPVDPAANASIASPGPVPVQDSPAAARNEQPALADSRSSVVAPAVASAPPIASLPPATPARLDPLADLPETVPAAPRVVAGAEGIASPESSRSAAALTALPSTPAPDGAAARSEEQTVRAALGRYESAYNRLDAAAAASVWPGVNQRALASAFQGLSAQSISLGGCNIRVSGATAHAECSGTARWTPKVGGGAQSAQRQWRFDLRNAGGNWSITQATTR